MLITPCAAFNGWISHNNSTIKSNRDSNYNINMYHHSNDGDNNNGSSSSCSSSSSSSSSSITRSIFDNSSNYNKPSVVALILSASDNFIGR